MKKTDSDRGLLRRLWSDERGAAFVEFILVVYAFLFILLGVVQAGLMVCASFFTNYANFMALRAASVWYEPYRNGFINQSEFESKCKGAALQALGPMERYWYNHEMDFMAQAWALSRIRFVYQEGSERYDGKAVSLKGRLEYDYPLIVPFVGRVIAGLVQSGVPEANQAGQGFAYDTSTPFNQYPLLTLRSNNDIGADGSPPRFHEIVIQRRWKFPAEH